MGSKPEPGSVPSTREDLAAIEDEEVLNKMVRLTFDLPVT